MGFLKMNNFMGENQFSDMFKKFFETYAQKASQPLDMLKNSDVTKYFNPTNLIEMSNKFLETMPWLNFLKTENTSDNVFDFAKNIKGLEIFSDLSHLSLENAQAMIRRQGEIFQKYSNEYNKFLQNISTNPQANVEMQSEFAKNTFESLINDFKELSEMYSKAHLENFEAASSKVVKNFGNKQDCATTTFCSSSKGGSTENKSAKVMK